MGRVARAPVHVRMHVFAHDHDLRSWLLDELALMSPPGSIDAIVLASLDQVHHGELLLVGIDHLTADDVARLRELILDHAIVIGVGSPHALPVPLDFMHVLDTKLTSRQLKRAVRDVVALATGT